MDVGQHSSRGDGHTAEQLVQLLVVADGELNVAGGDTSLLVVASGIAGELENLSSQVFENGSEVHGGTSTDALCDWEM